MSLCPQGASIHVCHHPSAKVTVTLFPGGWGLLGRGSQLKFRGFQGRGRGWDRVSGARGPVCRSSSHPVSNGAAAPCSCPRGADERMVSPRPLATRTEAASKQEAMSPGLVASHLVKEKKSGGERGEEREKWGYGGRAGGREGGSGSVGCVRFLRISASLLQTSHAAAVTSAQAGHVPALRVSGHLCLQALVSPLLGDGLTPRAW